MVVEIRVDRSVRKPEITSSPPGLSAEDGLIPDWKEFFAALNKNVVKQGIRERKKNATF